MRRSFTVGKRYGIIHPFPIDYAFRPRLRDRLTLGQITLTLESLGFRRRGISPLFSLLMPAFSLPSPPAYLPVHLRRFMECSSTTSIATDPQLRYYASKPRYIVSA